MRVRTVRPSWLLVLSAAGVVSGGCATFPASECDQRGDCPEAGNDTAVSGDDAADVTDGGADSILDSSARDGQDSPSTGDGASDALICTSPTIECGGQCVDPSLPAHCGSCTNVCAGPDGAAGHATCTGGVCGVACDPDASTSLDCRRGACVDPTSPAHCGSCSNACPPPPSGNGSATCTAPMTCGLTCSSGHHLCAGDCLPDTDVPSNTGDPCVVSDAFGVFVSTGGSDSNAGTMASPVATVGKAMDLAKAAGKRVYACGSAQLHEENLVVGATRDGVAVYGGLDCSAAQWKYDATKVAVVAPTTAGYALQMTGLTAGVTFEDFAFTAKMRPCLRASSIAVFAANSSNVVLRRCAVRRAQVYLVRIRPQGHPTEALLRVAARVGRR